MLLNELRAGKLGRMTFETPKDLKTDEETND